MKFWKFLLLYFIIILVILGGSVRIGFAQPLLGPWGLPWTGYPFYSPYTSLGGYYFPQPNIFPPLYRGNYGLGLTFGPITNPLPALLSPYQRRPNATIIFTSPTLTAVSSAPGVILIGATGVLGVPTVVVPSAVAASVPTLQTVANPVPAPLFSILAVLYASALLDGKALLSTANPLLFAYLSTLVL